MVIDALQPLLTKKVIKNNDAASPIDVLLLCQMEESYIMSKTASENISKVWQRTQKNIIHKLVMS